MGRRNFHSPKSGGNDAQSVGSNYVCAEAGAVLKTECTQEPFEIHFRVGIRRCAISAETTVKSSLTRPICEEAG